MRSSASRPAGVKAPGTARRAVTLVLAVILGLLAATPAGAVDGSTAAPVVADVAPRGGPTVGGNAVTILGSGFTGTTAVHFGLFNPASFTVVDDTRIDAVAPPSPDGPSSSKGVKVLVNTPSGWSTPASQWADSYTYHPAPPAVTLVDPATGPTSGGTVIQLGGSGPLQLVTGVRFGGVASPLVEYRPWLGRLEVVTPSHAAGAAELVLETGGWGDIATGQDFTFANTAPPAVTEISPRSGPDVGGTSVTITGTFLAGATAVRFGTTPAASFTVDGDDQITAVAPPLAAGATYAVFVETPTGTSPKGSWGTWYTPFATKPSVESVTPKVGPAAGGTAVTITGTGFSGATEVRFGSGNPASSFTVVSSTRIDAVAPPTPGTWGADTLVTVFVTSPTGTSEARPAAWYRYEAGPPAVTALTPKHGPAPGGTVVTVTGKGFTGTTGVRFGQQAATDVAVVSDTQLVATSPAYAPGTVANVFVETPRGTSPRGSSSFYWYDT